MKRKSRSKSKSLRDLTTNLPNDFILDDLRTLSDPALRIYIVLLLFADYTTGISYPKQTTIMEIAPIGSVNTIRKARIELQEKGHLTYELRKPVDAQGKPYGRARYFYTLTNPGGSND